VSYVPVDVSAAALAAAKERIEERHPEVAVEPIRGRYEEAFPLFRTHSPSMVVFLGSTIGNFDHGDSLDFWRRVSDALDPGDHFLLGVDLVKDVDTLEAAYNDAAGVTARFTKNLFERMNRELGAGIDLDAVEHVARYRADWQRIEIFARFTEEQRIHLRPLGRTVTLGAGEMVMTEVSRKFVLADVEAYLANFGFSVEHAFTDEREWFGVVLLRRGDERSLLG
jgi:L-histidine N-alpha-methyltransferase